MESPYFASTYACVILPHYDGLTYATTSCTLCIVSLAADLTARITTMEGWYPIYEANGAIAGWYWRTRY